MQKLFFKSTGTGHFTEVMQVMIGQQHLILQQNFTRQHSKYWNLVMNIHTNMPCLKTIGHCKD